MLRIVLVVSVVLSVRAFAQAPCASRVKFQAANIRDARLDNGKLVFCTSDVCWSMDPSTRAFTPIATIPKSKKPEPGVDPTGRATANAKGVELCPSGKASCKSYAYSFKFEGSPSAMLNTEGTLGAVVYQGDSMENQPTWTILYDLAKPKEVKRLKAEVVHVFGKTFWIGDTIYGADGKKVGKVSLSYDSGPVRLGPDLVAVTSKFDSKLFVFDATTAKPKYQVDLNLLASKGEVIDPYMIVPDGSRVHVVAGSPNSGEVITVDVATGKQLARSSPPLCAGTYVTAKPRKPSYVAKLFFSGEEVVQTPLAYWLSANAGSDACTKLGSDGTSDTPATFRVLAKCIRDELGKLKITDATIEPASIEVAMASIDKPKQQRMRDAAKGATIFGVTYGKRAESMMHVAVQPDGRISAVWINSSEY